jgi:HAD superfamily phosphatase (TIGR01668 family)
MNNNINKEIEDQNREGFTFIKLLQIFRLFLPSNTKTLARLNKFTDLNLEKLKELKNLDIKGLILDVDDCIAHNHKEVLKENLEYIKTLHAKGIKIVLYSNMKKTKRYDSIERYVEVLTNIPPKPDVRGFKEALKRLSLQRENVLMVGDNYVTDSGSLRVGIRFVKIKPLMGKYDSIFETVKMLIYSIFREFYDLLSRVHDIFREKPLSSKDLKS